MSPFIASQAAATHALKNATTRLNTVQAALFEAISRAEGEWRHDVIALRRQLQQEIGVIAGFLEALRPESDEIASLRNALSRMRTSVALHQANWPAVAIDRDEPRHEASVQEVRAASRNFVAMVSTFSAKSGTR